MISGLQTFHREIPQQELWIPLDLLEEELGAETLEQVLKGSISLTSYLGISSWPSASLVQITWTPSLSFPEATRHGELSPDRLSSWGHLSLQRGAHNVLLRKMETYRESVHVTASLPLPLLVPLAFPCPSFSPLQRIPDLLPLLCRKYHKAHTHRHTEN